MTKMTTAIDIDKFPRHMFQIVPFSLQHSTGNKEGKEKVEREGEGTGEGERRGGEGRGVESGHDHLERGEKEKWKERAQEGKKETSGKQV